MEDTSALMENQRYSSEERDQKSPNDLSDQNNGIIELSIHIALTAGPVQQVIIGSLNDRMDYCVYGECVSSLGTILDASKRGMLVHRAFTPIF